MDRRTFLLAGAASSVAAQQPVSRPTKWPEGTAGYHKLKLDAQGRMEPWYGSGPSQAYDHVIRRVWDFWSKMKPCSNGVPYYLQHQVWKPEEDSRGLGGDQIPMALDSWSLLYQYLGDPAILADMRRMADYWLAHGLSKPGDVWANLPFPYNTNVHSGQYDGDMRAGPGFLQPDKAGSFGTQLVRLHKMTGERRYLDAAVAIADTLAKRAKPGEDQRSPWPFRVHAKTGEVHTVTKEGKTYKAGYTTNWTPTLSLFVELAAMDMPNRGGYLLVAQSVWNWMTEYVLSELAKPLGGKPRFGPFFEDIPTEDYSDTEINAGTLAHYLLAHSDQIPESTALVEAILRWTERELGNYEFRKYDVIAIDEQTRYRAPGNSHTARHAAISLMLAREINSTRKNQAIRQLNWATYTVDTDGKNRYPQDDIWLTDGYGDYVRHYLRAMAAFPELAPNDQNHMLSCTSPVSAIEYTPEQITYQKFDTDSTDLFKLGVGAPAKVRGGFLLSWDEKTRVAKVRASARKVVIALA